MNRTLFRSARYRLLEDVRIDFEVVDFEPQRQWLRTLQEQGDLPAVRTVTVVHPQYDYTRGRYRTRKDGEAAQAEIKIRVSDLCSVLSAMPGLRLPDWQGNKIPRPVLHHLASLPHIRLSARSHQHDERELRMVGTMMVLSQHRKS